MANIVKWRRSRGQRRGIGREFKKHRRRAEIQQTGGSGSYGKDGDYSMHMGLAPDWAARIIRLVGNYGEIYVRNVGVRSGFAIPRGINQNSAAGGILRTPLFDEANR